MRLRRDGWKGKAKSGPEVGVRRRPHPAAMRFDDAAANRQTHAHAVRFCRENRIENSISILYAHHQPSQGTRPSVVCPNRCLVFIGTSTRSCDFEDLHLVLLKVYSVRYVETGPSNRIEVGRASYVRQGSPTNNKHSASSRSCRAARNAETSRIRMSA